MEKNKSKLAKQFSDTLRSLRKKHKLTQEQIAEKSGISYKNYQVLERGTFTPNLLTVYKIALAYNMKLSHLLKNIS